MQPPEPLALLTPRTVAEMADAAHATQANVVTLAVAWERLIEKPEIKLEIRTPPPGPVRRMREILLDRQTVKSYSPGEILLRLRQVWGEFCALCWIFPHVDPQAPLDFGNLPPQQGVLCPAHVAAKIEDVQFEFWRIRHEQRRRHDPEARKDPRFRQEDEVALMHPVDIYGQTVSFCPDEALFCAACEHAGMLAALRWASDSRWGWEAPGIMDVAVRLDSLGGPGQTSGEP